MADKLTDEKGWNYDGYTGDPTCCDFCGPDGPCNYGCIQPDPADTFRRQRKNMLDGDPIWEKEDDHA